MAVQPNLISQVRRAAHQVGFTGGSWSLIRSGTNDVFVNQSASVVARVAPDYFRAKGVEAQLGSCRDLVAAGVPILPPLLTKVEVLAGGGRLD